MNYSHVLKKSYSTFKYKWKQDREQPLENDHNWFCKILINWNDKFKEDKYYFDKIMFIAFFAVEKKSYLSSYKTATWNYLFQLNLNIIS